MNTLLIVVSLLALVGWLLGYYMYSGGIFIHLLLVLAIGAIAVRIIRGRSAWFSQND